MLASLKGELQVASATGVFLFHQELVQWTSGLVVKDIILFSNIFFLLHISFWLWGEAFLVWIFFLSPCGIF